MAEARDLWDQAQRTVRHGKDPLQDLKNEKITAQLSTGNSFQSVAEDLIEVKFVGNRKAEANITSTCSREIGGIVAHGGKRRGRDLDLEDDDIRTHQDHRDRNERPDQQCAPRRADAIDPHRAFQRYGISLARVAYK